jgi:hypothetical protein
MLYVNHLFQSSVIMLRWEHSFGWAEGDAFKQGYSHSLLHLWYWFGCRTVYVLSMPSSDRNTPPAATLVKPASISFQTTSLVWGREWAKRSCHNWFVRIVLSLKLILYSCATNIQYWHQAKGQVAYKQRGHRFWNGHRFICVTIGPSLSLAHK